MLVTFEKMDDYYTITQRQSGVYHAELTKQELHRIECAETESLACQLLIVSRILD